VGFSHPPSNRGVLTLCAWHPVVSGRKLKVMPKEKILPGQAGFLDEAANRLAA
jgi:hypothetical protein